MIFIFLCCRFRFAIEIREYSAKLYWRDVYQTEDLIRKEEEKLEELNRNCDVSSERYARASQRVQDLGSLEAHGEQIEKLGMLDSKINK
jgi:hypothetical protein